MFICLFIYLFIYFNSLCFAVSKKIVQYHLVIRKYYCKKQNLCAFSEVK